MKKYTLVGYIKRDDANYCFLIPIYTLENRFFFHKLSPDSQKIVDFTPYFMENYDHKENFKAITNYSHLSNRRVNFRKPSDLKRKIDDPPFFVFKFFKLVNFGCVKDKLFSHFIANCVVDPRFKNTFLRKEIDKVFTPNLDFKNIVSKAHSNLELQVVGKSYGVVRAIVMHGTIKKRVLNNEISDHINDQAEMEWALVGNPHVQKKEIGSGKANEKFATVNTKSSSKAQMSRQVSASNRIRSKN
jgi:hypothetical protein